MSWLRLDDGFAEHRKLLALDVTRRWAWVELLCWCARQGDGGRVPAAALERYSLDPDELQALGLLDPDGDGGGYLVHDWHAYNGAKSGAQRTAEWRDRTYGPARYSHGGRRGEYGSATSSVTGGDVTRASRQRHGDVSTRALGPHPLPQEVLEPPTATVDVGGALDPGGELLTARLLALVGDVDETRRDFIRGACARLPESVPAGLIELLEGGRARDPAGYVIAALDRELKARGLS